MRRYVSQVSKISRTLALYGLCICSLLLLTAGGASPLTTENVTVGAYQLILSFYSLPRAGQELSMTIESKTQDLSVHYANVVLNPDKGTDSNAVHLQLTAEGDARGTVDMSGTPPVRGQWSLQLTVEGSKGTFRGSIPLTIQGPPEMPTWLGWIIGLLPVPFLVAFIYFQITGIRKRSRLPLVQV